MAIKGFPYSQIVLRFYFQILGGRKAGELFFKDSFIFQNSDEILQELKRVFFHARFAKSFQALFKNTMLYCFSFALRKQEKKTQD